MCDRWSRGCQTIPKILVWAIPLLGFIGTVFGIGASVGGFTGFLENASDIDQIKEGIGTVTQGLAIAFDTPLLALFMSVLVVLPLVMVERLESRLLQAIDIYINDKVLPRLQNKSKGNETISGEIVEQAVIKAVRQNFPAPETLIEPVKHYAEEAAAALAKGFTQEVNGIREAVAQTVREIQTVRETTYLEGNGCELGKYGYNRDKKKEKTQIVVGLLCSAKGCPIAVEVFEGNTSDSATGFWTN